MKKRVHPEFLTVLNAFQDFDLTPEYMPAIRQGLGQAAPLPELPADVEIYEEIIVGPDQNDVRLRIYKPLDAQGNLPGLLWIHGGGYVLGTVEADDHLCAKFVTQAECIVVSVDYRLAPEHPYPAPIEDCYSALCWMVNEAEHLSIDKEKIGVAGASAGGGLTAALTLLARDRSFPKVHFQMPLYPMIDDRNNSPSSNEIKEGFIWNQKANEAGWKMYLGNLHGTEEIPPYAAPARATDYSNLPYTYTCVGQLDPFRDETIAYVSKLAQAGVDVEFHLYPGAYHGFETLNPQSAIAQQVVSEYINAVKRGFALLTETNYESV